MQAMQFRLPQPALRRLQLRMRPLLRAAGSYHQTRQSPGCGDAPGDSPIQAEPTSIRDRWFAERAHLGTPLNEAELTHGVNAGIISSSILNKGIESHGTH